MSRAIDLTLASTCTRASALLLALAVLGGCTGMRAGDFAYETDLDAAHRRAFREGWQGDSGVHPLWSVDERGWVVRVDNDLPATGPPANGTAADEADDGDEADVVGYEARLATYGGLGLAWYKTSSARWAEDGKPSYLNERTAILGGFLAVNEVTVHRWKKPGARPHAVHDWRFLLGFVGYREEPGRRVVTIVGLPIPLPWAWE